MVTRPRNPGTASVPFVRGSRRPRKSAISQRAKFTSMLMLVVVRGALEERALLVAARGDEREQVQNLVARQLVQQALRHDRNRDYLLHVDITALEGHRFRLGERILDNRDLPGRLLQDDPLELLAGLQLEAIGLILLVDLRRRFEDVLQYVAGRHLGIELGQVGAELVSFAVEAVAGNATGDLEEVLAVAERAPGFHRRDHGSEVLDLPLG